MAVLLQINNIHKAYGAAVILDGASASFADDQKIGMIGRNGAGKSTLCRIITGHETSDEGAIVRNSELKLGYLEQHDDFGDGETVLDYLVRKTGAEPWECGMTGARFQLHQDLLGVLVRSLPGGYQTRVKLAAMLIGRPNFLLLDEPSNYLDLSTMILLENFLLDFGGGYLIVSHDREFLKRTCDHTLELEAGRLILYPGNIEEYFEFKEEENARKQAYNRGIQKKRDQLQVFIDRFKAKASTASRAQSKMKQLSKLKTIEIAHQVSSVRIYIPEVERKAGLALSCDDLTIGYPEKEVARGIAFDIDRGEHVAVLGDNGQGKTTFLRTIAGDLAPREGGFRWGSGLRVAYYAQHVFSSLHAEDDIYAHLLRESAPEVTSQEILTMAGCFLFKGDDVKKKVRVLSGGERARLVLAGLLLSKCHVLLLDEPTNHLDFETVEALGHALKRFSGTVFFISHDRTFVNLVATQILEVKNGAVRRYPGIYEDYVYHLEMIAQGETEHAKEAEPAGPRHQEKASAPTETRTAVSNALASGEALSARAVRSELSKLKKKMEKIEQRMNHYARERDKLLEAMSHNPLHFSRERNAKLKELQVALEEAEEEWCALQETIDKLAPKA
ncbi:MAG: ABC-F family ATP-binding cassette domain-containing protein [Candidatus Omnitrophota bacterium]